MLSESPAWTALERHRQAMDQVHMRDLFAKDTQRFAKFSVAHQGLFLDYSKHRVTEETMKLLFDLARVREVESWRSKMFAGERINNTENRAVLHTALRRPAGDSVIVDGDDIMPFVHDVLNRMRDFSHAVRSGAWTGHTGKAIRTVVNIGIGGSDLGPLMACDALKHQADGKIDMRFVSNVDGAHLTLTLKDLDPEATLFLIASKTFTTQETMANAHTARRWLLQALKGDRAVGKHFAALSTNEAAVKEFGIAPASMFPFRDWVGGRYSLWSAIGLPICLAYGFDTFRALLDGAYAMDRHFQTAPLEKNIPVIMALLGIWYRNFWDAQAQAALPYAQTLARLPAWLQQLDMESNGKSVDRSGRAITYKTGPIVFGTPGTDCQHSYCQLIHQGTALIPCDFIGIVKPVAGDINHHRMLLANMLAQSQALMQGRTLAEANNDPQRVFPGNRPSSTILLDRLDAAHLGMLLALYEHKVFVQGIIWNINSFDQWGVELGKGLANTLLQGLEKHSLPPTDASTEGLFARIHNLLE